MSGERRAGAALLRLVSREEQSLTPVALCACCDAMLPRCCDSQPRIALSGGRRNVHKKKRKFEVGRQAAHTKLVVGGEKRIHVVRARGGHSKVSALSTSHPVNRSSCWQ